MNASGHSFELILTYAFSSLLSSQVKRVGFKRTVRTSGLLSVLLGNRLMFINEMVVYQDLDQFHDLNVNVASPFIVKDVLFF